jgi:NAD(P)H-dependent FMN reductase
MTRRFSGFLFDQVKEKLGSAEKVELLDLTELPLSIFHPDSYAKKPDDFQKISDQFVNADALLITLPEYNGAAPGVFKYFLDMLPFPKALYKIPSTFFGVSAGRFGAVRSVEQVQQVFQYRNALVYPENLFIPAVGDNLSPTGEPTDAFVRKLFDQYVDGFIDFAKATNAIRVKSG